MALGYLIAQIDVHDPDSYSKYTAQTPGIAGAYGGKFIVRAGQMETLEGAAAGPRVVVIEFPSYARAQEFYNSAEYQAIVGIRHAASTGSAFIVEGAD
jgi:uncharacterized protein (DUF1330 family)